MTNEAQLFYDEVREKSITARSAHNKRRRSPFGDPEFAPSSDVYSCSLSKAITYQDFKNLSKTTQKKYLEGIIAKYEVGPYVINKVMGCSGTTIAKICKDLGIKIPSYTSRAKSETFIKDFAAGKIEKPGAASDMKVNRLSVTLFGAFESSCVIKALNKMITPGDQVRINITIEKMEAPV